MYQIEKVFGQKSLGHALKKLFSMFKYKHMRISQMKLAKAKIYRKKSTISSLLKKKMYPTVESNNQSQKKQNH